MTKQEDYEHDRRSHVVGVLIGQVERSLKGIVHYVDPVLWPYHDPTLLEHLKQRAENMLADLAALEARMLTILTEKPDGRVLHAD